MSLKLKSVDETSVYISEGGYLVIQQVNGMGEESHVLLSPEYARMVADEIYRQLEDTSWWGDGQVDQELPATREPRETGDVAKDFITKMNLQHADKSK